MYHQDMRFVCFSMKLIFFFHFYFTLYHKIWFFFFSTLLLFRSFTLNHLRLRRNICSTNRFVGYSTRKVKERNSSAVDWMWADAHWFVYHQYSFMCFFLSFYKVYHWCLDNHYLIKHQIFAFPYHRYGLGHSEHFSHLFRFYQIPEKYVLNHFESLSNFCLLLLFCFHMSKKFPMVFYL